jgi:hypothetical protein
MQRRVVIPRRVYGIQQVVGIEAGRDSRHGLLQEFIGIISRGQTLLHLQRRATRNDQKIRSNLQRRARLRRVVAVFPTRVLTNSLHHHFSPHEVAPCDLHRQAAQRHQRIHEIGIGFAPDPRVQATHRSHQYQTKMVDAKFFLQQFMLRRGHIVVFVLWKLRVHPVAGLARFFVAQVVGKDHVVEAHVQQLPRSK